MQISLKSLIVLCLSFSTLVSKFEFSGNDSCLEFQGENSALVLESSTKFTGGSIKLSGQNLTDKILFEKTVDVEFDKCLIRNDHEKILFTGSLQKLSQEEDFRATTKTNLVLNGNENMAFGDTSVSNPILVKGKKNSISGRPIFSEKIVLEDTSAELFINLQNKLSQNIVLNNGTVVLSDDLTLKDGVGFEGSGVININNFRLSFPVNGIPNNNNISFKNANDIQLSGYTTLNGTWNFSTAENSPSYSTLNGYGNVLDLSGGGVIEIGDGHTLYITGVTLKGLGSLGGSINMSPTAAVCFTASNIELKGNLVLGSGKVSIISPNCKLIVRGSDKIVLVPGGTFEVDGVVFQYEALGNAPIYPPPFLPFGGNLSIINSGVIQSTNFDIFKGEFQLLLGIEQGINYITGGVNMTANTVVHFVNENVSVPKIMVLDMTNQTIKYDIAYPHSVVADENVRLEMRNGILDNLDYNTVLDLKGTGASKATFSYGDGVSLIFRKDNILDQIPQTFVGNAVIEGNSNVLTICSSNMITISGNKTLTIKNLTLKINHPNGIRCLDPESKIIFQNVSIILGNDGMIIDNGSFEFKDYFDVSTTKSSGGTCPILFSSKGLLLIASQTFCTISKNIQLIYAPTQNVGESLASMKRRIILPDRSSILTLSGCQVDASSFGLALDSGNLIIDKQVSFSLSNQEGKELELLPSLRLAVNLNSTLQFDGILKNNN